MMISIVFIVFSILVKMDDGPFVPFSLFFSFVFNRMVLLFIDIPRLQVRT